MEDIKKEAIEKWLKEHQFQYTFHKKYLFIKKTGIGWKIPLYEFKYSSASLDTIFENYLNKSGNSLRWYEGDTLYSMVVD